jgi:hypothetical protein
MSARAHLNAKMLKWPPPRTGQKQDQALKIHGEPYAPTPRGEKEEAEMSTPQDPQLPPPDPDPESYPPGPPPVREPEEPGPDVIDPTLEPLPA